MKSNTNRNSSSNKQLNNIISSNNALLKLFCTLIIIVVICILIGNYAFKNGSLTCDHYVLNTYLYIILAILLVFMVILINDKYGIFNSFLLWMSQGSMIRIIIICIILLILLLGLSYALLKVNPNNIVASNTIWTLLILILGISLIPTIWFGRLENVVGIAGISTILITIGVGLLGYYYGDKIVTFDWDKYLNYALWALIGIIFIGMFIIENPETMFNFIFIISILILIIFILLLLSNHKKLKENSEKCIDGKTVPNYPVESFNIFIKMLNVFQELIRIFVMIKKKK